jgi:predicted Zn-dependent protease
MSNPVSLLSRRSHRRWFYPLLSVAIVFSIFIGTPQAGQAIPLFDLIFRGVQVIQLSTVSDRQEIQIGQQINQQLVSSEIRLYQNPSITSYVNEIGQRLAAVSNRPDIPYTFQVVNDRNINAFATMGGFVYVNAGLVASADNEAQLASVMAHEIGHIASRHAIKQMRQVAVAQGVSAVAGINQNQAVQIGLELALRRPKSRQAEFEADQQGLVTLGRAGYAQSAMIAFMEKLLGSNSVPTFLSDHPATGDRIAALKQAINPQKANVGAGLDSQAYKTRIRSLLRS